MKIFSRQLLGVALLLMSITVVALPEKVSALNGSDFNAGRIIDDGVFYDSISMNTVAIQQFLDAKVPNCDTNGTQAYAGTTAAAYGTSKGYPPPYTCLKNYRQTTTAKAADQYCAAYPSLNQSTAEIIYGVSRNCGINPRVLLVLLQKEQGLITDDWPWSVQYRSATGYACPDTAPCDTQYYGFFNQLYSAARQFKIYQKNASNYNHIASSQNNVRFSPNSSCGSSSVYIQNQSTAGLYNYTPYQPNQAALNNLYGTGDSCSAYGNRNFWRWFNDWFGSTFAPSYGAEFIEQSGYPSLINSSQRSQIYFKFKNVGLNPWYDDISAWGAGQLPVRLGTDYPLNRNSAFSDSWKLGASRPADVFSAVYEADGTTLASNQHVVQPGQIARFSFSIKASPSIRAGTYYEHFKPIVEGIGPIKTSATYYIGVTVSQSNYSYSFAGQSSYPSMNQGQAAPGWFSYKNTGNVAWYDDISAWGAGQLPVRLGTDYPLNRNSAFSDSWKLGASRPADVFSAVYEADGTTLASNQHVVQPGQIARFSFNFRAKTNQQPGFYPEAFRPVVEGWGPMNGPGTWLGVTVRSQ